MVGAGWFSQVGFCRILGFKMKPKAGVYGPRGVTTVAPDVVFVRLNGKQAMMLHDACPDIKFEGKPQCHVIPMAKDHGKIALSVGCMLSRVRTGMSNNEMPCAIPPARLGAVISALTTWLLHTPDAADQQTRVDLGGRRIIKTPNSPHNANARPEPRP